MTRGAVRAGAPAPWNAPALRRLVAEGRTNGEPVKGGRAQKAAGQVRSDGDENGKGARR
jgi:hypothetical protein